MPYNLPKVCSSMCFFVYLHICVTITTISFRAFPSPQKETLYIPLAITPLPYFPPPYLPQPYVTTTF